MENNKNVEKTSISLSTILFITFLVMKFGRIGDVANWSWWWVTSPLWIPILLVLLIGLLFLMGLLILKIFDRN
jgi:hypothetical protein